MTSLLTEKQRQWLREKGGMRIDALDTALTAFVPRELETLIALRRQIQVILQEAREVELASIISSAERADHAGALDVRNCASMLLALLRGTAQVLHVHEAIPGRDRDAATGLLNAPAFMRRLDELESTAGTQMALAAMQIVDFDLICNRHGEETGRHLLAHIGGILTRQIREGDHVAHMRRGEFAIFLPDEDPSGLQAALARIDTAVMRHPFEMPDGHVESIRVTMSGCSMAAPTAAPDDTKAAGDTASGVPCVGVVTRGIGTEKAIGQVLRQSGFNVVSATHDGDQRLAALAHQRLHLIIVEDTSAGLAATLAELRRLLARKRAPIIAVVENVNNGKWAAEHGANEFILKPIAMDELLKIVRRLTERGRQNGGTQSHAKSNGLLVASDNVSQLISIGSALQKQGGCKVRLGLGSDDAVAQALEHKPDVVLIDLPLGTGGMVSLCRKLCELRPEPLLMFIASEEERRTAVALISRPHVAGVIPKPVHLLKLPAKVREATGITTEVSPIETSSLLREEILRIMRVGFAKKT